MKPEDGPNNNEIYNDKEKAIIEEDKAREERIRKLEDINESIRDKEAKLKRLGELHKELDELEETEEPKIDKKMLRRKKWLGVSLICLGCLIVLWGTVWFLSLEIGYGIFVSIFIFVFGFLYGGSYEM